MRDDKHGDAAARAADGDSLGDLVRRHKIAWRDEAETVRHRELQVLAPCSSRLLTGWRCEETILAEQQNLPAAAAVVPSASCP